MPRASKWARTDDTEEDNCGWTCGQCAACRRWRNGHLYAQADRSTNVHLVPLVVDGRVSSEFNVAHERKAEVGDERSKTSKWEDSVAAAAIEMFKADAGTDTEPEVHKLFVVKDSEMLDYLEDYDLWGILRKLVRNSASARNAVRQT
jgi:hypothetical protein